MHTWPRICRSISWTLPAPDPDYNNASLQLYVTAWERLAGPALRRPHSGEHVAFGRLMKMALPVQRTSKPPVWEWICASKMDQGIPHMRRRRTWESQPDQHCDAELTWTETDAPRRRWA